jgi:hypothetical protein
VEGKGQGGKEEEEEREREERRGQDGKKERVKEERGIKREEGRERISKPQKQRPLGGVPPGVFGNVSGPSRSGPNQKNN